jgi:hypothetical protein
MAIPQLENGGSVSAALSVTNKSRPDRRLWPLTQTHKINTKPLVEQSHYEIEGTSVSLLTNSARNPRHTGILIILQSMPNIEPFG